MYTAHRLSIPDKSSLLLRATKALSIISEKRRRSLSDSHRNRTFLAFSLRVLIAHRVRILLVKALHGISQCTCALSKMHDSLSLPCSHFYRGECAYRRIGKRYLDCPVRSVVMLWYLLKNIRSVDRQNATKLSG